MEDTYLPELMIMFFVLCFAALYMAFVEAFDLLAEDEKFCSHCLATLHKDAHICPDCQQEQDDARA